MELIRRYFPDLTPVQYGQLDALQALYADWNAKINVISRKDMEHFYLHHVLHSLAPAKCFDLSTVTTVLDAGTGGGFPGIPLAILYPNIGFTLLDATGKKVKVATEVAAAIGLENVTGVHARLEDHKGTYDLVVTRAVSTMTQMTAWTAHLTKRKHWLYLKGGDQKELRKELPPQYAMTFTPVQALFDDPYFEGKFVIEVRDRRGKTG
jgi:16S rRNA (guanine527-N7)-methyltransferase